jgi:hypothetical protein
MKLPGAREGLAVIMTFAGIVSATSGEVWVCTFPGLISTMTVKERFEVRTTDVLRDGTTPYRIVENSNRGVIATYARADAPDRAITIGTLAIDKPTGDFVLGVMVPGAPLMNKIVAGKCQKTDG